MPPGKLTPKIESSAPEPFGVNKLAPISFPPTTAHPRPFTLLIPPNLPTYSESPSLSSPLIPPKQSSVKIEDVEDKDIKMHSLSLFPPKAGPSQYNTSKMR